MCWNGISGFRMEAPAKSPTVALARSGQGVDFVFWWNITFGSDPRAPGQPRT
jgi:hypothetical protein